MIINILFEKVDQLLRELDTTDEIDSRRVLHGRGRCYDGLEFVNIDFYQPVLLLTCYREPPVGWLHNFVKFLSDKISNKLSCVIIQRRYLPQSPSEILLGELPESVYAKRGALKFHLHLNAQQNAGFFLDMEAGRQWLEENVVGKKVLNLFAYTCAFSVVAIAAGAEKVVNVDMSSSALNTGRSNHSLNKLPKERSEFLAENILKSWSRIKKRGPFDLVVIDPPSYQKGSFVADKDYAKVIRRLPELMPGGGLALLCLNAPELSEDYLKSQMEEQLPTAKFLYRIAQNSDFPDVDPEQQLKLLVYEVPVSQNE